MAKILLIDDMEETHQLVKETLSEDHIIFSARGWAEANQYLFRDTMDLVLIDINMPGMKGDQLAKIILETSFSKKFNLVLFSAMDKSELRKKAREVGAGYIHKTFDKVVLRGKIEKYLEKRESKNS